MPKAVSLSSQCLVNVCLLSLVQTMPKAVSLSSQCLVDVCIPICKKLYSFCADLVLSTSRLSPNTFARDSVRHTTI